MEDLSLHILDIVENSLRAGAENIIIRLTEHLAEYTLVLEIEDDGIGMDADMVQQATNPFFTTKEGKKCGIGLPLLAQAAQETGGQIRIAPGHDYGLKITALFHTDHPDMKPCGDIRKTVRVLQASHQNVNILFEHIRI